MKHQVALPLLVVLVLLPAFSFGWQGKVVGVSDGDTITVLHDGKGEKIRVYGIDCPEKGQDFGQKAKQFTSDKVFGKRWRSNQSLWIDIAGRSLWFSSVVDKTLAKSLSTKAMLGFSGSIAPNHDVLYGLSLRSGRERTKWDYGACQTQYLLGITARNLGPRILVGSTMKFTVPDLKSLIEVVRSLSARERQHSQP